MDSMDRTRVIIAAIATVAGLLIIVPVHYWGILALALKAVALCGTCVLAIRHHLRRH